jgi:hypothetical protein
MEHIFLLKVAVCASVAVGLFLGISFLVLAYLRVQSIRGKDVDNKTRCVTRVILVLFTALVGIYVAIQWVLT